MWDLHLYESIHSFHPCGLLYSLTVKEAKAHRGYVTALAARTRCRFSSLQPEAHVALPVRGRVDTQGHGDQLAVARERSHRSTVQTCDFLSTLCNFPGKWQDHVRPSICSLPGPCEDEMTGWERRGVHPNAVAVSCPRLFITGAHLCFPGAGSAHF